MESFNATECSPRLNVISDEWENLLNKEKLDAAIAVHIPHIIFTKKLDATSTTGSTFRRFVAFVPLQLQQILLSSTSGGSIEKLEFPSRANSLVDQTKFDEAVARVGALAGTEVQVSAHVCGDVGKRMLNGGVHQMHISFTANVVHSAGDVDLEQVIQQIVEFPAPRQYPRSSTKSPPPLLGSVIKLPRARSRRTVHSLHQWYIEERESDRLPDPNKQRADDNDKGDGAGAALTLAKTPAKVPQTHRRIRVTYDQANRELSALTTERRDEINAQFAAVIKPADDYDAYVVDQLVAHGHRMYPNIQPFAVSVDDRSVRFAANFAITKTTTIPVCGKLSDTADEQIFRYNKVDLFVADDFDLNAHPIDLKAALAQMTGQYDKGNQVLPSVLRQHAVDAVILERKSSKVVLLQSGYIQWNMAFRLDGVSVTPFLDCDMLYHVTSVSTTRELSHAPDYVSLTWRWPSHMLPQHVSEWIKQANASDSTLQLHSFKIRGDIAIFRNQTNYSVQPSVEILPEMYDQVLAFHSEVQRQEQEQQMKFAEAEKAKKMAKLKQKTGDTNDELASVAVVAPVVAAMAVAPITLREMIRYHLPLLQWRIPDQQNNSAEGKDARPLRPYLSSTANAVAAVTIMKRAALLTCAHWLQLTIGPDCFERPSTVIAAHNHPKLKAIKQDTAAPDSMSLDELLTAWHYEELLPLILITIRNKLRLFSPTLVFSPAVSDGSNKSAVKITGTASTGNEQDDCLVLIDYRRGLPAYEGGKHKYLLLKIHQKRLLTANNFITTS